MICFVLLVPYRFLQLWFSGKESIIFSNESLSMWILLGGMLLSVILLIIMNAAEKNASNGYVPIKNSALSVTAMVAAVAVLSRSLFEIYVGVVKKEVTTMEALTQVHPTLYTVSSVLGIAVTIMLFITSGGFLLGKNIYKKVPMLSLFLPIWCCLNLIVQFIPSVSGASIMENVVDVVASIFVLLFFLVQAKTFVGIEEKKAVRLCFVYGCPAVLFSAMSALVGCLLTAFGKGSDSTFSMLLHITNLSLGLYIFSFLLLLSHEISGSNQTGDTIGELASQEKADPSTQEEEALQVKEPQAMSAVQDLEIEIQPVLEDAPAEEDIPASTFWVQKEEQSAQETADIQTLKEEKEEEKTARLQRINTLYEKLRAEKENE